MKITQSIAVAMLGAAVVDAFAPMTQRSLNIQKNEPSSTSLYGAFNKRNKQADLMKKMQEAKRQREMSEGGETAAAIVEEEEKSKANKRLSDEEMKKQNDLKRFQELLDSESATVNYDIGGSNYKTKQQEEEEIDSFNRGVDRMFEGDPAPTDVFEDLVNFTTGNALGKNGASRVVPWLNKSSAKQKDVLVVLTDPREKSSELRSSLKSISKLLPADIRSKMIIINADTPAENRRFLKKNEIENLNIYCDEKREWMREYTVLGDKRWAMNLLVLQEGRVERLVREVDVELVSQVIKSSVTSLKK